ncbi:hypothetical protein RND81_08G128600 [Saponaria officinalis]|uniref:Retrotransposon Copia-like N-terminal domain-containing protein n=1 Tax=Saponaria officinalis TaxID=3572 RepID=A0AAW1J6P4_SAPOF
MSNSEYSSQPNSSTTVGYEYYDDPFYLSSSDQPHLQIVGYSFDGTYFLNWKRDVVMVLTANKKEGFINGDCVLPPKNDKGYHQWLRCDLMVMKWILNSLEKSIRGNFMSVTFSKQLWIENCERYGEINGLELFQLKKELSSLVQNITSLVEYYGTLNRTWEQIDSLHPLPQCTCGVIDLCSCQLLKKIVTRDTNAKLIQLLMGLNSSYEAVRSHILSMEPFPQINKTLSMLQRIERQ